MSEVLVLNAAYQPIGVVTWQEAFTKMYSENAKERVEVVAHYNKTVNSAHESHVLPCVVRHIKFRNQKKKAPRFSRANIWSRDRGRCQYCNKEVSRDTYTFDHIIPKSKGGQTNWTNIVTACQPCNTKKGNRTPVEAGMRLTNTPVQPTYLLPEFTNGIKFRIGMPDEWRVFFGV